MTLNQTAALRTLANDRFNGTSIFALTTIGLVPPAELTELETAGLIAKFTRRYSRPAGLTVDCYRITAAGLRHVKP